MKSRVVAQSRSHPQTARQKREAASPSSTNRPVVQLEQAPGWYYTTGVFSGASLRADNAEHSKKRQLNKNEVIEVIDKGGRISNFNLPAIVYSPKCEHSWVRTQHDEFGWIEDSELKGTQKPPGRQAYADILAEQAEARAAAEAARMDREAADARQRQEEAIRYEIEQARIRKRLLPVFTWRDDDLAYDRQQKGQINKKVEEHLETYSQDVSGDYDEHRVFEAVKAAKDHLVSEYGYQLSGNQRYALDKLDDLVENARRKRYPIEDKAFVKSLVETAINLYFIGASGSDDADKSQFVVLRR